MPEPSEVLSGLLAGPSGVSLSDIIRSRAVEDAALADVMRDIGTEYPALGRHQFAVRRGSGPGYLEFYPAWESQSPSPGQHVIEVRDPALRGEWLRSAIAGDALHLLGAIDPRSGRPVDPVFHKYLGEFERSMTKEQRAFEQRAYQRARQVGQEARPFEQYWQTSRRDAYIRGFLFPDERDEWRRAGIYTEEQVKLLERMRSYLRSGRPH